MVSRVCANERTSMIKVHIVSDGFRSSNSRALLYPIIRHNKHLRKLDLSIRLFSALTPEVGDCDTLAIDGKAVRKGWGERTDETLEKLAQLRRTTERLLFFDTTDSAGFIVGDVLPHVDRYYKHQLLIDRTAYTRPMYGRRAYTDYYHREFGVVDSEPMTAPQISDPHDLHKLRVAWNAGLANYDVLGLYQAMAYHKIPVRWLLTKPRGFIAPTNARDIDVHTRMGLNYPRETIAWQRREIARRLADRTDWQRVGRRDYLQELGRSRLVVAPFGWGEFTYKDYETFITGGLLIKPDMSHMETWPNFYLPGETMLTHRWDLSDLDETLQRGLEDPKKSVELAGRAQQIYRHFTVSDAGRDEICERIKSCLT